MRGEAVSRGEVYAFAVSAVYKSAAAREITSSLRRGTSRLSFISSLMAQLALMPCARISSSLRRLRAEKASLPSSSAACLVCSACPAGTNSAHSLSPADDMNSFASCVYKR